jgi:hypothetical protein
MGMNDSPNARLSVSSVFRHPGAIFPKRWNWKAALLSAVGRAPVFLITTFSFGWRASSRAVVLETAYRAGTAGIFASIIQEVRNRRPIWLAISIITVAVPAVSQVLDYVLHFLMHTPNLHTSLLVSLIISAVTSLFSWYSMRRGTLLVGREQDSFAHDLCKLPRLILGFIIAPPVWIWRYTRHVFATCGAHNDH